MTPPQGHLVPHVQQPAVPPVIRVQQQAGGGVVRSTIDAAKFVAALLFLGCIGTCVYVCGGVGKAVSDASEEKAYVPPPRPVARPADPAPVAPMTPREGREDFARAVAKSFVEDGINVDVRAVGTDGTALEIVSAGCSRTILETVRNKGKDGLAGMGFRTIRCAGGPEIPVIAPKPATKRPARAKPQADEGTVRLQDDAAGRAIEANEKNAAPAKDPAILNDLE